MPTITTDEHQIGISAFLTKTQGIGGILRSQPEDFQVKEIFSQLPAQSKGKYTLAQITSKNWETNHLITKMADQLRISRKRISFSGTKDKKAVTTQWFSFSGVAPDQINKISLKDISIHQSYRSSKGLTLGDHTKNSFTITIRDISPQNGMYHEQITEELKKVRGFPNYFGVQRFGSIRPITHVVGKHLVFGRIKDAVMTYLTAIDHNEQKKIITIRKQLAKTHDYHHALNQFPKSYTFEKSMLQVLIHKTDYVKALEQLPKNLLTMFVYAYQSYLFNKILSERMNQGIPIHQAVPGDVIIPLSSNGFTDELIPVSEMNLSKVNEQLQRGKASVSTVLIGAKTVFSEGSMGEIERIILKEEKLDPRLFIIPEIPYLSSNGTRRPIFVPIHHLSASITNDHMHQKKKAVTVSFDLFKGCYATSILREYMKASSITRY